MARDGDAAAEPFLDKGHTESSTPRRSPAAPASCMADPYPMNPRSLLFTLYGDYAHPLGREEVRVAALVRLAADLGVSGNALRSALSRMTREGWLVARREGGSRYRLSDRGRALIDEGTRRIYGRHRAEWDGQWLLVSYSVPEPRRDQRDRLRQGLSFLGFGALGNGLFCSPHDLRREVCELVRRCQAADHVTMHRGSLEWPAPAQVVARAWDLKRLEERYRDFLGRVQDQLSGTVRLDPREGFQRRFMLTHEFRRFLFSDPDLPDALLPPEWVGGAARESFLDYNRRLRRPAERYFLGLADQTTIVDNGVRRRR